MAGELDAYVVLGIAERMERNAAKFYRKAAGMSDDPGLCELFVELARWEKRHGRAFAEMKERLPEPDGRIHLDDPAETAMPLVFADCENPPDELVAGRAKADVLRSAIRKEEEAIAYYGSLKASVLGPGNIQVVEAIVEEEKQHVRILSQSLEHRLTIDSR